MRTYGHMYNFSGMSSEDALEKHTPVQWKDGVGPLVVPGGSGHCHQEVAEEIAKKGPRVARVEKL